MTHNLILGALVADAAARGLHWLYDPARIANVAGDTAAFTPVDPANFDGAKGILVHAPGHDGASTQYGETLMVALRVAASGFDIAKYQTAYAAHFGAGGPYQGYIDRPTRGTLAHLAAGQTDPSGIDDDQHPALSALPAVVWAKRDASDIVQTIRVTNVNDEAARYGMIAATMMADLANGTPLSKVLKSADDPLMQDALTASEPDSIAYGEVTGRACHLPQGLPLSVHILSRTTSYKDAIEANIRTGGDSAGRAMFLGALAGQAYGIGGDVGIPLSWLTQTHAAAEATALLGV